MGARDDAVQRYRAVFAQQDRLAELEGLLARAWPALTILDMGGWRLRAAKGFTRRANSVWPRPPASSQDAGLPLPARLANVERFYRTRGIQPCFQVGPTATPRELARVLAERGYRAAATVQVRTGRIDRLTEAPADTVTLSPTADTGWLASAAHVAGWSNHHVEVATRVLAKVAAPMAFAVHTGPDGAVAVARGTIDGGWLGIDLLAATAGARTPAVGRALLAALARHAVPHGAERVHVWTERGDEAGRALLRGVELRPSLRQRYWTLERTR